MLKWMLRTLQEEWWGFWLKLWNDRLGLFSRVRQRAMTFPSKGIKRTHPLWLLLSWGLRINPHVTEQGRWMERFQQLLPFLITQNTRLLHLVPSGNPHIHYKTPPCMCFTIYLLQCVFSFRKLCLAKVFTPEMFRNWDFTFNFTLHKYAHPTTNSGFNYSFCLLGSVFTGILHIWILIFFSCSFFFFKFSRRRSVNSRIPIQS